MDQSKAPNNKPTEPLVVEIKIRWEDGKVQMQAPDNMLLFRRVMIDVEETYLQNFMATMLNQNEPSRIIDPKKPGGPIAVDKRVHQAAQEHRNP